MLVLDLLDRALAAARPAACFAAGYALAEQFDLVGAEPDLPTAFFPEQGAAPADAFSGGALAGFPPGCYVDPEPALEPTPAWALDRMHVPAAWAYSEQSGRPSRGKDVIVAQPDTGITAHVELVGVAFVPGFDVIDDDNDPTDPLTDPATRGTAPGTASVLVSLDSYVVTGSAPQARLMPIRTIESVVRIRQITVARAIDWAIQEGAHVVTMSLGGIPASALHRAITPSSRGRPDRPGRCRELRAPGRVARSVRRMHRRRGDERRRRALARHLPRRTRRHLGAGPERLPRGRAPRWPQRRRHGRPRAGHELRGRPHRRSGGTVGCSPRASRTWSPLHMPAARRSRRCSADCCRPRPADRPLGRRCDGPRDRRCARTPRGELRPGPWSRGCDSHTNARADAASSVASLVAEAVGAGAVPDDALDWHRFGPELATALLRRQLPGPHDRNADPSVNPWPGTSETRSCATRSGSDASGSRTSSRAGKPRSETRRRSSGRRLLVQEQGDVGTCAHGGAGVVRPDPSGERGADRILLLRSRTPTPRRAGAQQPQDGDGARRRFVALRIRVVAPRPLPPGKAGWARPGSNRRHPRCKRGALPTELQAPARRRRPGRRVEAGQSLSDRGGRPAQLGHGGPVAREVAGLARTVDQGPPDHAGRVDEERPPDREPVFSQKTP